MTMALKSMAYSKAEQKERNSPSSKVCESPYSGDKYPYGLRLDLNKEALKKIDMKSLPKPGTKMILTAEVEVVAARQSDRVDGDTDRSIELQIVKLDLSKGSASSAVAALEEGLEEA
jgi:hypothetical protein